MSLSNLSSDNKAEIQSKHLEKRFEDLINRACIILRQSQVSANKLCSGIALLHTLLKAEVSEGNPPQISNATSTDDIVRELNPYWNYLNYNLLQNIVDQYGDETTKSIMEHYVDDVDTFRRMTPLQVYWNIQPRNHMDVPSNLVQLVSKLSTCWSESTLEEIETFRKEFSQEYSLPRFVLMLSGIERDPVVINWLVPVSIVPSLKERMQGSRNEFFTKLGISMVSIDNVSIYETSQLSPGKNYAVLPPRSVV